MYFWCVSRALNSPPYLLLRRLLREARESAGLTQLDVAQSLWKPQSFVSKCEAGDRQLDVVEFVEYCGAIGISATELVSALEAPTLDEVMKARPSTKGKRAD